MRALLLIKKMIHSPRFPPGETLLRIGFLAGNKDTILFTRSHRSAVWHNL